MRSVEQGWGLLNACHISFWVKVACGVILLDFVIYLQHVMFHSVPVLWRLHMMHHADLFPLLYSKLRTTGLSGINPLLVRFG